MEYPLLAGFLMNGVWLYLYINTFIQECKQPESLKHGNYDRGDTAHGAVGMDG